MNTTRSAQEDDGIPVDLAEEATKKDLGVYASQLPTRVCVCEDTNFALARMAKFPYSLIFPSGSQFTRDLLDRKLLTLASE